MGSMLHKIVRATNFSIRLEKLTVNGYFSKFCRENGQYTDLHILELDDFLQECFFFYNENNQMGHVFLFAP